MWGKNHCSTHRVFELNMNFQMLLFFVRPYDISRFLRFRTICVIFRQIFFLHIFVHGVYMKLDNISFSSPKIIRVNRDITCGCPYDIHRIALQMISSTGLLGSTDVYLVSHHTLRDSSGFTLSGMAESLLIRETCQANTRR